MRIEFARRNERRIAASEEQAKKYIEKGFRRITKEPAETGQNEDVDLSELNLAELKELAKNKGLTGYSALKKEDLIQILEGDSDDESGKTETENE